MTFSIIVFLIVGVWLKNPLVNETNFMLAILLFCLAAFIENLVEPYYYTMLWKGDLQGKVKTELVALSIKSILTYGLLLKDFSLLAYSIAQLAYSIVLVVMYPCLVKLEMPLAVTSWKDDDSKVETRVLIGHKKLVKEFAKTSFLKFFLTEGEKLIMIST